MAGKFVEYLLGFALDNGLIGREDAPYCRNLLLNELNLDEPAEGYDAYRPQQSEKARTAHDYLERLCDFAVETGALSPDTPSNRAVFASRLMGCVTLPPSSLEREFARVKSESGIKAATDWFYAYCRACDYIQVDAIEKNIAFKADSPVGELEITINLSKPEKDPRDIAAELAMKKSGYPKCLLCPENTGLNGGGARPGRRNHRMLPVTLGGSGWHVQFSPYLYYPEHLIALNDEHVPMKISRAAFERLFDFVDQFPHYFIGSNADLPIVGGSILTHDHFQGGGYDFPMDRARDKMCLDAGRFKGVKATLADWPMTCVRLRGENRGEICDFAELILEKWRAYDDHAAGIIGMTGETPHSTVTPILRKHGGEYCFSIVLRNNRTDDDHPLGIFHPHTDLHHIKKENIGLIEVMGLFILPGRLKDDIAKIQNALVNGGECPPEHSPWVEVIKSKHKDINEDNVGGVVEAELAVKCARVLCDAGVFKQTDEGLCAFQRFWESVTG